MEAKYRVVSLLTKKTVAYEYQKDNGMWIHCLVDSSFRESAEYPGTYPYPGIREQFTGRRDCSSVEEYVGDRIKANGTYGVITQERGGQIIKWKHGLVAPLSVSTVRDDFFEIIGSIHDPKPGKE